MGLSFVGTFLGVAALAGAYFLGTKLGLCFVAGDNYTAFLWPPTGIAVAFLFRAGLRYWPGLFIGALACQLQFHPSWVAVGIASGNALGPVLTVLILKRSGFDLSGACRRALFLFVLAGLAGMTVTASNATLWRAAGGLAPAEWESAWLVWWLGDTAGVLIVAPPLMTATWPRANRKTARTTAGVLLTAALTALAFTGLVTVPVPAVLLLPPFMMLIWVGLTGRPQVGSLHVLAFVIVAIAGTSTGRGAYGHLPPVSQMLVLWVLTTTTALIVLAMTMTLAERERAEAALAAAAADYQALVDGTPAAIVRYTADGTLTFVNETLCRLLECQRESLVGASVLDFIPDMPRAEAVTDLPVGQRMTGPGGGASGTFRCADGSTRWYRWTARLITTADGRSEYQAVGIDLTERRQAEQERAAIERKMQDAQRLEALGVLAGGVAHDFNNLLAGVLGHAELAVAVLPQGHPAREHIGTVIDGVAQAGGLTRQLLAYSGKGRFLLRSIDLNALIVQTTELLRLTLPKKVTLNLSLAQGLPPVTGDDGQLRQVLMNLLINAGEAIGDKAGTVTITTVSHELVLEAVSGGVYSPTAPGRFMELIVSDTGCGMDETTKARLFDPFFSTKFAGRGLGLSAVLGIIRGHGGGIRVDSRPGVGTQFTVLLPTAGSGPASATTPPPSEKLFAQPGRGRKPQVELLHAPSEQKEAAPSPRPVPAATVAPEPQAARGIAIVADDEPTVLRVGELVLKQLGFEVLTATNGQEAMSAFDAHADHIRLVLLDLMMPVMDGTEVLAAIRARSSVPVILCSGYTAEAVPEELAGDTVTTFLQKPYSRAALQTALTAVGI